MLKDKTIYLTSMQIGVWGLQKHKSTNKFEALTESVSNYFEFIEKNDKKNSSLDIVIESNLCRYVVLPGLNHYPEPDVLNFLIQQRLQQKYVDFDSSQFVIAHDQLKSNHPCLVVAFPRETYQGLMKLKPGISVKSLLPSILAVWNYYQKDMIGNQFLIIEDQLVFLIHHDHGVIQEIDTFPAYLMGSLNFDYYLDLNNLKCSDLEQTALNKNVNFLSNKIFNFLKESHLDKSQALNLMRALS